MGQPGVDRAAVGTPRRSGRRALAAAISSRAATTRARRSSSASAPGMTSQRPAATNAEVAGIVARRPSCGTRPRPSSPRSTSRRSCRATGSSPWGAAMAAAVSTARARCGAYTAVSDGRRQPLGHGGGLLLAPRAESGGSLLSGRARHDRHRLAVADEQHGGGEDDVVDAARLRRPVPRLYGRPSRAAARRGTRGRRRGSRSPSACRSGRRPAASCSGRRQRLGERLARPGEVALADHHERRHLDDGEVLGGERGPRRRMTRARSSGSAPDRRAWSRK